MREDEEVRVDEEEEEEETSQMQRSGWRACKRSAEAPGRGGLSEAEATPEREEEESDGTHTDRPSTRGTSLTIFWPAKQTSTDTTRDRERTGKTDGRVSTDRQRPDVSRKQARDVHTQRWLCTPERQKTAGARERQTEGGGEGGDDEEQ